MYTCGYSIEPFQFFLSTVLNIYPTGKIITVLDNARVHHAKRLQPFLEANSHRLKLVILPPYSPGFNLMEGVWN
ncbi:transposase [Salimicrobium jeotgali]|uniref:transposase n=1 Tax=Salimicrobium jeotgali TaxID=1230341 RepID=UPI000C8188AD